MNKIFKKQIVCEKCGFIIRDLNRHFSKDKEGLTRCEKHIKKIIPKKDG